MTEKKIFEALNKKITIEPTLEFDRRFWNHFEQSFGQSRRWYLQFKWVLPVTLSLFFGGFFIQRMISENNNASEARVASWIIDQGAMLAELDLYTTLDDVAMSDEDWDILLNEEKTHES